MVEVAKSSSGAMTSNRDRMMIRITREITKEFNEVSCYTMYDVATGQCQGNSDGIKIENKPSLDYYDYKRDRYTNYELVPYKRQFGAHDSDAATYQERLRDVLSERE